MRLPAIPILVAAALLCGGAAAGELVSTVRPLSADAPHLTSIGAAELLGILQLQAPGERWFGGLSGMVMDGDMVTAVNDSGHWLRFRVETDADGRPLSASGLSVAPLGGLDGSKDDGDAEELVATPEGLVVGFERRHRLLLYPGTLSAPPRRLAGPAGLGRLPANGGIEAAARLPDGRLLLVAEEGDDDRFPAWIGRPGAWERLAVRRSGSFRPTAAAVLPGGDVLLLERSFSLLAGVAARLSRIAAADLRAGAEVSGRQLAVMGPPMLVDNYEALAVRARADGRLVAYVLSDDNFNPLQATLLAAILLP